MNIIKSSPENLTMKQLYDLTKSPEIQKLSTVKGEELVIDSFCIYEDVKQDGTIITILSLKTDDGEMYATNSKTFTGDFLDILAMCEESNAPMPHTIRVMEGTSRAGRSYISCVYID